MSHIYSRAVCHGYQVEKPLFFFFFFVQFEEREEELLSIV